ncbi:MAG: AI-2E family transporter [Hyphomicrobiales bacterium]|nr:AI-2E family transporter [Hyphomicrobiales bacterium]
MPLGNASARTVSVVRSPEGLFKAAAATALTGMIFAFLYLGRGVLTPLAVAVILAFILSPIVLKLRPFIGRGAAVGATVAIALAIVLAIADIFAMQVGQLAGELPRYRGSIETKIKTIRETVLDHSVLGRLTQTVETMGQDKAAPAGAGGASDKAAPATAAKPGDEKAPMHVVIDGGGVLSAGSLREMAGHILEPVTFIGISLIFLIFVLLQREDLRDRFIRLVGARDMQATISAMDDAASRLSRYFLIQTGLNAAFGVIVAIGLWLVGVPAAPLWGLMAMVLRFVPYIGSFIAAAMPIALAAAIDPGWSIVVKTALIFVIGEPIMGHVIEPLVYGKSTGLSPIAVIVAAAFWTSLWGPVGLILSTPLTLCLVVLGRYVEGLSFLEVLFGDAPPLTPAESLYQRLLAGDSVEAAELAEDAVEESSLDAFYGETAVAALGLAEHDRERGALRDEGQQTVLKSLRSVIEELADEGEGENNQANAPAEWRDARAILCLGARTPLDDGAAAVAADLLRRRGYGVTLEPHEVLRSDGVFRIDPEGVKLVLISALDRAGSQTHLRYTVRKLRRRLPGVKIAVGAWLAEPAAVSMAESLGADFTARRMTRDLPDIIARASSVNESGEARQEAGAA